ncbi:hypothetical protein PPYR_15085 [Photinus pyralis]|uniref:DDE Tnp4 domain-containing protein n=1 Tax=Photinus pyralis TaxID=7054 RepID=A0A5N3ZZL3_PHOPY|nr:hypothetical protein PPYR_15085 [Photinus pyralis]
MSSFRFDHLLSLVGPHLNQKSNRGVISPSQRLAISLRFLATGDNTFSIASSYCIGRSTVSLIVKQTMIALCEALTDLYLPEPTQAKFSQIANDFWLKWNMPNCCGALDGKHIRIDCPANSGSLYFNYKKYFSIVLLAVCDANYNFVCIDIGAFGSLSDGAIFHDSYLGQAMESNTLNLPLANVLPSCKSGREVPYFIVGDAAFPLKENLMRPYPGQNLDIVKSIFNYRLSRARRCIENSFGILQARWRIFSRSINSTPDRVDLIVKSCVCLHNYLKNEETTIPIGERLYCPPGYADSDVSLGQWRHEIEHNSIMTKITQTGSNNSTIKAKNMRDELARYFMSPQGFKKGQIEYVKRTK